MGQCQRRDDLRLDVVPLLGTRCPYTVVGALRIVGTVRGASAVPVLGDNSISVL
jgi:hypothetical protein